MEVVPVFQQESLVLEVGRELEPLVVQQEQAALVVQVGPEGLVVALLLVQQAAAGPREMGELDWCLIVELRAHRGFD